MMNRRAIWVVLVAVVATALFIAVLRFNLKEPTDDRNSAVGGNATGDAYGDTPPNEVARTSDPPEVKMSDQRSSPNSHQEGDALPGTAGDPHVVSPQGATGKGAAEVMSFGVSKTGQPTGDASGSTAPVGWHLGNDGPSSYVLAFVWQAAAAEPFRGQRIRFSAYLRIADVAQGAHLTMRAEDSSGRIVAFDNMNGRWIQGSADWRQLALVVDIPETAAVLIYGAGFIKPGSLWIDEVEIIPVEKTIKVTFPPMMLNHTNTPLEKSMVLQAPFNLGFETEASASQ